NSRQSEYEYSFKLKLNKLTAVLNEDGTVSIMDEETGKTVYSMPAPFMFDDNGVLSTDVYYTLTQKGKYEYELTVTASTEWINATGRKFPVTIDPTIETNTSYGEAYVSSANPNSNYKKPSDGQLLVGSAYRTFFKFELPDDIPANAYITDATLSVKYHSNSSSGTTNVGIYAVPYSWNENTITWNNSVGSHTTEENATANVTTDYLYANNGQETDMYFGITSAVRDWYAGKANNGIAIRYLSGSNNSYVFKGYNSGETTRPIMEITYLAMDGILNGTYFLRNMQYNTYMQAPSQSETNQVNLYPFDGDTNQKWNFEYLRNGYYKITINDGSNRVLTAPASNGTAVSLSTTYNVSPNQMWGVTYDHSIEGYRLYACSNHSCYLSGSSNTQSTVRPVEGASLQSDKKDEWIFYQVSNGITPEIQRGKNWCWLTCARMLASAFVDNDCLPSQEKIAEYVVPPYWTEQDRQNENYDIKGDNDIIIYELSFIFGSVNIEENYTGRLTDTTIMALLNAGIPIIANLENTHYVLIYGYDTIDGESEIANLYVYDPYNYVENSDLLGEEFWSGPYKAENQYSISIEEFNSGWNGWLTIKIDNLEYECEYSR
ncbi:MAG: DNRLRE domain-containing protein, partial [Clostridia bacterium]|nr:DNRLRE domain-containing protein [Clostridia bacterium]